MKLGIKAKHTVISISAREDPMRKIAGVAIEAYWSTSRSIRLPFPDYPTSQASDRRVDGKVSGASHAEPRWSDCM
jgi:hypothetical protein